jgi:hypothetical protein
MDKIRIIMLMIIFLIGAAPFANAGEESLVINLETGDTGESLGVAQLSLTKEQIALVNDGQYSLRIKICNGIKEWFLAGQLAARDTTEQVDEHQLNMVLDAALNLAREQNVNRLLTEKGLTNMDVQYIHDRAYSPSIEISLVRNPLVKSVSDNRQRIACLEETVGEINSALEALKNEADDESEANRDSSSTGDDSEDEDGDDEVIYLSGSDWSLRIGSEHTVVGEGRPVTTITVDLEIDRGDWMIAGTGGYLPQGDEDQRFGAVSLAYLPGYNKFGLVARMIYASRNLTGNGGYLQEGYGPTVGLIFRNTTLTAYLTGGLQYFDRQRQSRRGELTLNLGVKLHALSF